MTHEDDMSSLTNTQTKHQFQYTKINTFCDLTPCNLVDRLI
jgi:hypothetical protein